MPIKAIETIYPWPNGNRYRSRLEARFAVFLDKMDIPFTYEEEGYDLGDDLWYLPDFRIYNYFVEIKAPDRMTHVDVLKTGKLAALTGKAVFICALPENHIAAYIPSYRISVGFWGQCPLCRALGFADIQQIAPSEEPPSEIPFWCPQCSTNKRLKVKDSAIASLFTPLLLESTTAARQARFEHR